jgi:monoamine oxidase
MKRTINRRGFLGLLSVTGASLWLPACSSETAPAGPTPGASAPKRVIVLGGGLAGLTAAYELMKKGHHVTVIEAQDRPGGRVRTLHDGFMNGQYAELGAVRIPDVHEHTLGYVEELGLELDEYTGSTPLYYLKGKRFVHEEGKKWPLDLTDDEQANGLGMWSTYVAGYFEEFGDPKAGTYPKPGILDQFEAMTFTEFVKSKGASDDFMTLYVADNGTEIEAIGAVPWMSLEIADQAWDKSFHVRGGNDQIPKKLAEKLGARVLYGCVVTRIAHSDSAVEVQYMKGTESATTQADYVVCAIPFTTLRKVEISPPFADDKMHAIQELKLMNASRAYIQTKTRFWEEEGITGVKLVKTDTAVERLWDLSNVQDGTSGILMVYTQNENAVALTEVPITQRQEHLISKIEEFFPTIREEQIAFHEKAWSEDPWALGAWTDLLPGQWWMFDVMRRPEGRIHFAGEHTSLWSGWMQGAIESGKRAAEEIESA